VRAKIFDEANRKWWTLGSLCFALFMIMLDNTVVNVALPAIKADLGISTSELEWTVAAYALTFASLTSAGQAAHAIAPAQYHDVEIGEAEPVKCLDNGLWLCGAEDLRYAVLLSAHREHGDETGVRIGMKPAGGIRTAKQSLAYLVMVKETLGDEWLTPDLFRFGASTLVNDVLMQIVKTVDGNYQGVDYFSLP